MPDITKGYTFSDSKADWASQKDTAIRLNKMIDEAKVNITAGSGISVARTGGNIQVSATGGGGTVTNVSVVTANGVSGTVANSTTTPAITLALGAITPTSVAASGSVTGSNLSGTNTGDQTITLTGDVTGSGTGSFAATIGNSKVTYAKIQNVSATDKVLGRSSAGAGVVEEITCTAAGRALIDDADASAQRTTLGLGTLATQNGTFSGTSSGTNTGDQTITLTGDVTGSGTGSFAATIANDAVTNSKLANVATATIKGRVSSGTGDPEDLTGTQATTLLDTFTSSLKGLAPASGGGTTNFLRADGTWATPASGTGTVTSVSVVTANGVSGTVANSTTTPAITLSLGAITPTSVAATGTVTGSNLSGTNTGDQTITLTGDVTGSGTGSFATTIANGVVTNAKLQNSAITIAGTSTSLGGSITLDTIDGLSANGLIARTSANTRAARTITGGTGITVTNGDGVSGNPTITATAVGVPTTGNQYSRLVKDISGTITSNSHMKWVGPDVYNVKDYGAAGDNSTDDTTAIRNAFDAAITAKGTVFFPQGIYKITGAITKTVTGRLSIVGCGRGVSVIKQVTSGTNGLDLTVTDKKQVTITGIGLMSEVYDAGTGIKITTSTTPSSQHNASGVAIYDVEVADYDPASFATITDLTKIKVGTLVIIKTLGNTNWVSMGFLGEVVNAGSFVNGTSYSITTVGTTDFTLIGAANNNVGTVFVATGAGTGTGTATKTAVVNNNFIATASGSGTGEVYTHYGWANGIHFHDVWNGTVQTCFIAGHDGGYYGKGVAFTGVCVNNNIHDSHMNFFEHGIWFANANSSFTLKTDGSQRNHEGLFIQEVAMVPVKTGLYIVGDKNFQGTSGAGSNGRTWNEGRITTVGMVNSHIDSRNGGYALYIKNSNSNHINSSLLIGGTTPIGGSSPTPNSYLDQCYESSFVNNTFFIPEGDGIEFVAGSYGSSCVVAGNVFRKGNSGKNDVFIGNDNKYIKVYGNVAQLALNITVSNTGNEAANNSVGTVGN